MDEFSFKKLSIQKLGEYLPNNGVSMEAVKCLEVNKVTGLALLLVEETELKELLQIHWRQSSGSEFIKEHRKGICIYIVYNCLYILIILYTSGRFYI